MTTPTSLLGLALPATGQLAGTWGTVVNTSVTSLIDSAIAGTTTLSVDADATLTSTDYVANEARQAILLWTASNGATTRNITAPARSKAYIVVNAGTGSIVLRGAGPTTGVTVVAGEKCVAAWNGSDFVKVASSVADGVTSVGGTGTVNGITLTGTVTSTGNLTLGGALTGVNLATQVTGTLPFANGGTGAISRQDAMDALAGAVTSGSYLRGNGTDVVMSAIQVADVPTLNQNTTGVAANVSGIVAPANGGTGVANNSANTITFSGNFGLTATLSGTTSVTFPTSGTLATLAGATTLTNKRIDPRVSSTASTSTLTPDIASFDQYNLTAQAVPLTVAAPIGTPVDGNRLIIRLFDNGTARAITWNATYTIIGVTLPASTTTGKTIYVGCLYNAAATRWDVVAVATQA